ncbi:MAG: glycerophosphodiester phosphodiesterase [Actinomycetota bacterium]|nr:glycerophosphodiester phosphodiesterase [Actinomycetota bacterium]
MTLDPRRWSAPVAIAHRGSRLLWPENTLESFSGAVEMGYRHLETDIRITKDEVIVCVHDETVDRTTNGKGEVSSFTHEELMSLDAGYRHGTRSGFEFRGIGVRIPSLEEVLSAFPEVSVVADMKEDGLEEAFADLIERTGAHDRFIVGSFSDQRIEQFRQLTGGKVSTSTGPALARMWVLASRVGRGGGGEASAIQVPPVIRGVRVVDEKLIDVAHASGMQVHVWTINDTDEMERLLDLGVDGLVTDRPDRLRKLLENRGEWES